jgi:hypothetical protein
MSDIDDGDNDYEDFIHIGLSQDGTEWIVRVPEFTQFVMMHIEHVCY